MFKLDFGSGYNPTPDYKTLDCNYTCDYYDIDEIPDNSIDIIRCRNVLHHIDDLDSLIKKFKLKLKNNGTIKIIDCNSENYSKNIYLDYLWYRYIFKRYDIYINYYYRDLKSYFIENGFDLKIEFKKDEKIYLLFKLNK
jgi:ubiquinone/menaquinone biosynthesis C-methylase UbiE